MKKHIISLIILALLPLVVHADAVQIDGIYYNLDNIVKTAEVTSNPNKYSGAVVIPEAVKYNGVQYDVTIIGNNAFQYCSSLTSITIPNSVTSIEICAFYKCTGLTSVTIPNSVTSIGYYAFQYCSGLRSISIGNSVTSIGGSAFEGCGVLTSITVGNSLVNIVGGVFAGCSSLTSIHVAEGNNKYDSRDGCNAIIETESNILILGCKNTVIPNSVTSIGSAFSGCTGLTSVTIPNSVTSIGASAFNDCTGLTSVTIPNSVTSIGSSAFRNCRGLTSVTIPNSVTSIGEYAFEGCSVLNGITIGNTVTSIGNSAFQGCSELKNVFISSSVTSIGNNAFFGCDNLLIVNSEILEPFNCGNVFTSNTLRNGTLYVPAGTKDLYARFDGWREFLRIEEVGGEQEQYVWLKIKDGRGSTMLKVKKGSAQELAVKPEAGWKILMATMDGTDISAQIKSGNVYTTPAIMNDATINIVYEKDDPSGTFTARQSKADIKVVDDGVVISNAEPQSRCVVYSSSGQQVVNTIIEGCSRRIPLQKGQVYILTINGRTLKFAL